MNNFVTSSSTADSKVPRHLETLATTVFQSLFPPINPNTTPLKSIKRVLLLNRELDDDGTFIINLRHYAITTRAAGVSRAVRRLQAAEKLAAPTSRKAHLPNLGRLEDIADYMIGGENGDGYATDVTSGSELDSDNEVEVLEPAKRKITSWQSRGAAKNESSGDAGAGAGGAADDGNDPDRGGVDVEVEDETVERRAVKMVELGPRLRLRLTKVEDGLCSGRVMWHEYVEKTAAQVKELDKRWEKRRQEKESRRKEQKANIERKKQEKRGGAKKKNDDDGGDGAMDVDEQEDGDDDDDEYFSEDNFDEIEAGEDEESGE